MSGTEPFFACKCSPGKTNRDWIPLWFSPVSRHQHAADGLYTAIRLLLFIWSSVVRLYSAGWQITVQRDKPLMWLIIQNLHKQAEQQAHFSVGVLSWDSVFLNKCLWRNLLSKRGNSLLENGKFVQNKQLKSPLNKVKPDLQRGMYCCVIQTHQSPCFCSLGHIPQVLLGFVPLNLDWVLQRWASQAHFNSSFLGDFRKTWPIL